MDIAENRWRRNSHTGRKWVGVFLLIVGSLFLARASGVNLPGWLFSWPMLLIGFGVLSGIRHNFRGIGWLFPILIGGFFLIDQLSPELHIKPYIWPVALIALGMVFLFRPKKKIWQDGDGNELVAEDVNGSATTANESTDCHQPFNDRSDVIDATAIFGGVKRNILSKNFKGGDVTTFMGGAEINLTKADWNGKVMIDCFNMFGGTKLIVPPDWDVQTGVVTVFGGIEDKRPPATVNSNKVLYLDGTCIFGGVEIKSY
jgi:predicted membrane protein